jgi:hypothetical protein
MPLACEQMPNYAARQLGGQRCLNAFQRAGTIMYYLPEGRK